jgi:uncharacterized protein YndB with AHSA1/START domain
MSKAITQLSVVHSTFCIERNYPFPAARVFAAFRDPATKRRWFVEGEGWDIEEYTADFTVGGREISRFRWQGGDLVVNETTYYDIVDDRRITFAYSMIVAGALISVSLATVVLVPAGDSTDLAYTEQGTYFDSVVPAADQPASGNTAVASCSRPSPSNSPVRTKGNHRHDRLLQPQHVPRRLHCPGRDDHGARRRPGPPRLDAAVVAAAILGLPPDGVPGAVQAR